MLRDTVWGLPDVIATGEVRAASLDAWEVLAL
jgi:hypothetical protein